MTSKSITARENRRRQKLRQRRPRADVRKVHRYGFRAKAGYHAPGVKFSADARRMDNVTCCGMGRGNTWTAVPDAAFRNLPRQAQCWTCLTYQWPGEAPYGFDSDSKSGTHEHLMAVELLVAMLQRLWQARLEVGHRCYVNLIPRDMIDGGEGREAAGYTFCTCDGEPKWLDARTSYCPPRLCPERAAWEAYYGMPYEQLPSQVDRRWAPSPGTIQRMLATKPGTP